MNKQLLLLIVLGASVVFAAGYIAGHNAGTNAMYKLVEEYMRAPRIQLPATKETPDKIQGGF